MLPAKYIDELRNVPPSELSSLDAQYNVCGFVLSFLFLLGTGRADGVCLECAREIYKRVGREPFAFDYCYEASESCHW